MIVEENKYRFKLELDVAIGIESFPMRTLSFGYKTLKMLRQAAARKKERYFVLGKESISRMIKENTSHLRYSGLLLSHCHSSWPLPSGFRWKRKRNIIPTSRRRVSKFPRHGSDELYSSFLDKLKNSIHQNKNKKMRDQVILARNALKNDIPLFTLVGKDKFALQTLEYYYSLAKRECSNEFIKDLELLIEDFRKYQEDNQATVKVPDL